MPIGEDALGNYAFQIEVDGVTLAQFKEVSGLSAEIQVIEHKENKPGAIPVIKKLPGAQKWGDITLKRGKTNDPGWWDWIKEVQEGKIDSARRNGVDRALRLRARRAGPVQLHQRAGRRRSASAASRPAATRSPSRRCTIVHEGLEVG